MGNARIPKAATTAAKAARKSARKAVGRAKKTAATALRRAPVQQRSRKRFEAILDAAGTLFSSAGFDATTMEAIAAEANTSIGSVYQFFPDKKAVFMALAERHNNAARETLERIRSQSLNLPLADLVNAGLDLFDTLVREDKGFGSILRNLHLYADIAEMDQALQNDLISFVAELIGARTTGISEERLRVIAGVVVQSATGVLVLSTPFPRSYVEAMIAETKSMLSAYLQNLIDG